MKLRNKKTGEIKELQDIMSDMIDNHIVPTLIAIENEWEDYEEPKEYWHIGCEGDVFIDNTERYLNSYSSIGNGFETKEEAEKAVEKLKAWKRLKDKGFRFLSNKTIGEYGSISYCLTYPATIREDEDLDLLFGGNK